MYVIYDQINDWDGIYDLNTGILVQNVSNYNLRNADDIRTIYATTRLYSNSFLPSTIRDWNNLPRNVRDVDTV